MPAHMEWCDSHFTGVSLTSYADDLCRKTLVENSAELLRRSRHLDIALDEYISGAKYKQHHTNNECVAKLFGRGSAKRSRDVYGAGSVLGMQPKVAAKYLGYK
eukprot:2552644-Heterocapsa_arctica.AAC.1